MKLAFPAYAQQHQEKKNLYSIFFKTHLKVLKSYIPESVRLLILMKLENILKLQPED